MIDTIDIRQFKIIKQVMQIKDENLLSVIEKELASYNDSITKDVAETPTKITIDEYNNILEPISDSISLEELKKEQSFKPIDSKEFFALAKKVGVTESVEDLLEQLD